MDSGTGLLLGVSEENHRNIRVVIIGSSGEVGKTITIHVEKGHSKVHPFDIAQEDMASTLAQAYQPLKPQQRQWTAVYYDTREVDNGIHHSDVYVVTNPVWDAEKLRIKAPPGQEPRLIPLPEVLAFLAVLSNPKSLVAIPALKHLGVTKSVQVANQFKNSLKQLAFTDIWDSFQAYDQRVKENQTRHTALLDLLAREASLVPIADTVKRLTQLSILKGDAQREKVDEVLNPLLQSPVQFEKIMSSHPEVAPLVADWLFRRTFPATHMIISRQLAKRINFPERTMVAVGYWDEPVDLLQVVLEAEHSRLETKHLREIWISAKTQLDKYLSPRKSLLEWTHLVSVVKNINFPFLDHVLKSFLRGFTPRFSLVLNWDAKTGELEKGTDADRIWTGSTNALVGDELIEARPRILRKNIWELIHRHTQPFATIVDANAPWIRDKLNRIEAISAERSDYTVFAPAANALDIISLVQISKRRKQEAQAIIENHVVKHLYPETAFRTGTSVPTLRSASFVLKLSTAPSGEKIVTDSENNRARVLSTFPARNGIIYIIDRVLGFPKR